MNYFKDLKGNIRFYILLVSAVLAAGIYVFITFSVPEGSAQIIRLTQTYALIALLYLYLAMLCGPFTKTFTFLPYRGKYVKARRALGVSAFLFATLHACFAFFGQLGGFQGLLFLGNKYLLAISLSFTAYVVLFLMAATSFDYMIEKLGFDKWKFLHRFVYLACVLILIHALMLGTHFSSLSGLIPQIVFASISFYLFLEVRHLDDILISKFPIMPKIGVLTFFLVGTLVVYYMGSYLSSFQGSIFNIHAEHIKLAKEAQHPASSLPNIPGLIGDKTKRYSVSFNEPESVQVNIPTTLLFKVNDASNGSKILLFNKVYEKIVHLIIVDKNLVYFSHIHPEQSGDTLSITTVFPNEGMYHLYLDFQPFGAIEQQFAFTLKVGNTEKESLETGNVTDSKTVDNYLVKMNITQQLLAKEMSIGKVPLSFHISNTTTHEDVKTLKPYLGAFGHLVMIRKDSFDYLHVHPSVIVKTPDQNGGPAVEFLPLGLYSPIKPGVYRVFAQFNPDNHLIVADFTLKVE